MQYEIKGGSFPVVECKLEDGEKMITESGSMVWMSPNMEMSTSGGGVGKMFSKAFSGENLFQNIYTANGKGLIAFGSSFPGKNSSSGNLCGKRICSSEICFPRIRGRSRIKHTL